jgi:hypothetical protein
MKERGIQRNAGRYFLPVLQAAWQPAEQPFWQPGLQDALSQREADISSWVPIDVFRERFSISRTIGSLATFAYAAFPAKRTPTAAPTEAKAVFKKPLRPSMFSNIALPPFLDLQRGTPRLPRISMG